MSIVSKKTTYTVYSCIRSLLIRLVMPGPHLQLSSYEPPSSPPANLSSKSAMENINLLNILHEHFSGPNKVKRYIWDSEKNQNEKHFKVMKVDITEYNLPESAWIRHHCCLPHKLKPPNCSHVQCFWAPGWCTAAFSSVSILTNGPWKSMGSADAVYIPYAILKYVKYTVYIYICIFIYKYVFICIYIYKYGVRGSNVSAVVANCWVELQFAVPPNGGNNHNKVEASGKSRKMYKYNNRKSCYLLSGPFWSNTFYRCWPCVSACASLGPPHQTQGPDCPLAVAGIPSSKSLHFRRLFRYFMNLVTPWKPWLKNIDAKIFNKVYM